MEKHQLFRALSVRKRKEKQVHSLSLKEYIKSDLNKLTKGKTTFGKFLEWYFFPRGEMFRFDVWYRVLLVCRKKYGKFGSILPYYILRRYEFKYGIHPNPSISIGPGLRIVHGDGVHFNCKSIGENFTIYQGVTMGEDKNGGVPIIGNNVTIYPNAVVVGDIKIGDGAIIGANSFVNFNVDAGETIVGYLGTPIKEIKN